MYQKIFSAIDGARETILQTQADLHQIPELGFREWKTHAYLKNRFEELGYEVTELGDIPGFYTDVDTGRPGPKIVVFGELDALPCPSHPFADPVTGAAHACGHDCQCSIILGVAAALKAPGVLDEMSGSVRIFAVPAEEGIEGAYRAELQKKGNVRYFAGKPEVLYRGLLDDVDMAMMMHSSSVTTSKMNMGRASVGNVRKKATFIGKSAHAGGSPHKGINALYAATTALSAANALRETFQEKDIVRMHPIITKGGNVVNAIPDEVVVENTVRAVNYDTVAEISHKVNRAFAGAAAAMGCQVKFEDVPGAAPRYNDKNLSDAFYQVALEFFSEKDLKFTEGISSGCTDMGDISCVMPAVHPFISGATGVCHGENYTISDPELSCVTAAKIMTGVLKYLLCNDAAFAKKVIAEKIVPYATKEEFFKVKDSMAFVEDGVTYNEDGTVTLVY